MDGNLANAGDVEGVDRKSTTVTEKPAAAAKNLSKKRKGFFYFKSNFRRFWTPATCQLPPKTYHPQPNICQLPPKTHNQQPNT